MMTSSKCKHFPRYWPFARGIHRSPVNSTHKGQWRSALMFSLICAWINGWLNNNEAGDLRYHCVHYDVTVMLAVDISVDALAPNSARPLAVTVRTIYIWFIFFKLSIILVIFWGTYDVIRNDHRHRMKSHGNLSVKDLFCRCFDINISNFCLLTRLNTKHPGDMLSPIPCKSSLPVSHYLFQYWLERRGVSFN